MASKFAKGAVVEQIVAVIKGTVSKFTVDEETGERLVMVEWPDADGVMHSRYFKEDEIQAAKS